MTGWYPDWQTAVVWLVVTAMASVIYFGSMTQVIHFGNELGVCPPPIRPQSRSNSGW